MTILSDDEISRYSRHIILTEFGVKGQEALKKSSVLLVGAGGLGSPMALYLAAAGVGRIGIVDFDVVDDSNLQRQIIHGVSTLGQKKLDSAFKRLRDLNPHIELIGHDLHLNSTNARDLFKDYDVIADGTDNFPTRYLINDACVLLNKPNVYASIFRFEGQITIFNYNNGPCYRCLYSEPPPPGLVPSCAQGGVLGVLPGVVGSLQANEVIKVLTGVGRNLSGRLLMYDALAMRFKELSVRKDPNCQICSSKPSIRSLIDYDQFCGVINPSDAVVIEEISADEFNRTITQDNSVVVLDVREDGVNPISASVYNHIPFSRLADHMDSLDRNGRYVVVCQNGFQSEKAARLMLKHQFKHVTLVTGGLNALTDVANKAFK